jgi:hypothetical protein
LRKYGIPRLYSGQALLARKSCAGSGKETDRGKASAKPEPVSSIGGRTLWEIL